MSGQKLEHAKQAAIQAVDRLSNEDIVSVITYNHTVNVLIPATKISDKNKINQQIRVSSLVATPLCSQELAKECS